MDTSYNIYQHYLRFIPTGVGNTMWSKNTADLESVHPHGCGEHSTRFGADQIDAGSSPRVWGTLAKHQQGGTD